MSIEDRIAHPPLPHPRRLPGQSILRTMEGFRIGHWSSISRDCCYSSRWRIAQSSHYRTWIPSRWNLTRPARRTFRKKAAWLAPSPSLPSSYFHSGCLWSMGAAVFSLYVFGLLLHLRCFYNFLHPLSWHHFAYFQNFFHFHSLPNVPRFSHFHLRSLKCHQFWFSGFQTHSSWSIWADSIQVSSQLWEVEVNLEPFQYWSSGRLLWLYNVFWFKSRFPRLTQVYSVSPVESRVSRLTRVYNINPVESGVSRLTRFYNINPVESGVSRLTRFYNDQSGWVWSLPADSGLQYQSGWVWSLPADSGP